MIELGFTSSTSRDLPDRALEGFVGRALDRNDDTLGRSTAPAEISDPVSDRRDQVGRRGL
jgi:hypothetical protein